MDWQPYREPLRATLLRSVFLAAAIGGIVAVASRRLSGWPYWALLALWVTLGGHYIEVWFLNWLRPRLPRARVPRVVTRLLVWFAGGILLLFAIRLSAAAFGLHALQSWPPRRGGFAFIAIELIAHAFLQLRGRPGFYNGRG
jgi:hypothetical protein